VTATDANEGWTAVTFKVALPLIDPDVAVMVAVPEAIPVTSPVCETVTVDGADVVQDRDAGRLCDVPSL
jgi:hypothetical protein